ncbi:MAG: M3 family metallopeptidase [Calditerrivibrio sp.]|nr:M3 family metallopeptidase [Calditerrivibrio sp.]
MSIWDLKGKKEQFSTLIEKTKEKIEDLKRCQTYDTFMTPYQSAIAKINEFFTPIAHINAVKNTSESQDVYNFCLQLLTLFFTDLNQSVELYDIVKTLYNKESDVVRKRALHKLKLEFELEGVHLDDFKRGRIKEINLSLSKLSTDFFQNIINDNMKFELTVESETILGEMPEEDKKRYFKNGVYVFNLTAPSYSTFIRFCEDEQLREKMFRAYYERAPQNSNLITSILQLRYEKAKILGYNNFAEMSLVTKTAKEPKKVIEFLKTLIAKVKEPLTKDIERLSQKSIQLGLGELKPHNIPYLMEKLRRDELNIKEDEIKRFFELKNTVKGMLESVKDIFLISFNETKADVWSDGVLVYDVLKDGALKGKLYFDLEARLGKKDGAWMSEWYSRYRDEDGTVVLPRVFIVANFPPSSEGNPSLLKHSDVETLFHEMGHALHHLLSEADDYFLSGINGVEWDVVEFPSQYLENFAFDDDILFSIGKNFYTSEGIDSLTVDKIKKERQFFAAYQMGRQLEFALFDMLIHLDSYTAEETDQILKNIRKELGTVEMPDYVKFQNQFTHIFSGGYAAGYYSYKWAELLSSDLFIKGKKGLIDAVNIAYTLFSKGGAINLADEYEKLIGDQPSYDSLLELYGISG